MANILIGYGNYIDSATLSSGTWASAYPQSNLKDRRLALVARTTIASTAAATIAVDLGSAKPVRAIGVINHNLGSAATIRVLAGATSGFATPTYNSGTVPVWTAPTAGDLAQPRPTVTVGLPTTQTQRYWRVEITDNSNPAGFIQLGRLFIGNAFQPSINMQVGARMGFETDTMIEKSLSGAEYFNVRPTRRTLSFALPDLPHNEAFGPAAEISRISGIHGEVLVIPDSGDTANRSRRDFLGRLRALSPIEQPFDGAGTLAFEVSELL